MQTGACELTLPCCVDGDEQPATHPRRKCVLYLYLARLHLQATSAAGELARETATRTTHSLAAARSWPTYDAGAPPRRGCWCGGDGPLARRDYQIAHHNPLRRHQWATSTKPGDNPHQRYRHHPEKDKLRCSLTFCGLFSPDVALSDGLGTLLVINVVYMPISFGSMLMLARTRSRV